MPITSPCPVHQRAAGVARVDGSIGLNRLVDHRAIRFAHRTNRTHDPSGHGSRKSKGIADRIHLLSHLQIARIPQHRWNQLRRLDLNHRQIVRRVRPHHRRFVFLAIVHGDFHLTGIGDDVVVGQNVPLFVDDESRTLSLLGNQPIEEIKCHGPRSDVYDRRNVLLVDGDIVLLFSIERLSRRSFGDLHLLGPGRTSSTNAVRPPEFERQVVK